MSVASGLQLHDIDDVEGFVIGCLNRSGIQSSPDEREDLIAEGICILYELARRYEPKREGHTKAGRFSGFAAQFLPRRLGDAWHAKNPHHFRAPDETGKRRWQYLEAPVSLDGMLDAQPNPDTPHSGLTGGQAEVKFRPQTHWAPPRVAVRPQSTASACA